MCMSNPCIEGNKPSVVLRDYLEAAAYVCACVRPALFFHLFRSSAQDSGQEIPILWKTNQTMPCALAALYWVAIPHPFLSVFSQTNGRGSYLTALGSRMGGWSDYLRYC